MILQSRKKKKRPSVWEYEEHRYIRQENISGTFLDFLLIYENRGLTY